MGTTGIGGVMNGHGEGGDIDRATGSGPPHDGARPPGADRDRRRRWASLAGIAGLVLLIAWAAGWGHRKVAPGTADIAPGAPGDGRSARAVREEIDDPVEVPATVTSRIVAEVAPRAMARVLRVQVSAGTPVRRGDTIAELDDRDVRAREQQAVSAVVAAQAAAAQADADAARARSLFGQQAMTRQDLDGAEARARAATAQLARAREALAEARVALGDAILRAPFDGVVARRLADPGDMAAPGRPIAVVHGAGPRRLEAEVPERCSAGLAVGDALAARLGPGVDTAVRIEEIAPIADPRSRTVTVKAALPGDDGPRPGAFATLVVPCGRHLAVLVPAGAIRRVGQLQQVVVVADGRRDLRSVRAGRSVGDRVEVLSGLAGDETVLVRE